MPELDGGEDLQLHEWVLVIVSSPRTAREARRHLEGERRVIRKLDLESAEDVRSTHILCAVCKYAPRSPDDMLVPCPGEPM